MIDTSMSIEEIRKLPGVDRIDIGVQTAGLATIWRDSTNAA